MQACRGWRWESSPGSLTLKTKAGNAAWGRVSFPRLRLFTGNLIISGWAGLQASWSYPSSCCWPSWFGKRQGGCCRVSCLPPGAEPGWQPEWWDLVMEPHTEQVRRCPPALCLRNDSSETAPGKLWRVASRVWAGLRQAVLCPLGNPSYPRLPPVSQSGEGKS